MKRVLITNEVPADVLAPLDGRADVILGPGGSQLMARDEVLRLGPTLDAIINQAELRVDAALLDACPRVRIIANVAMGIDNLDTELMARRGVWATNVPDAFAEATADLTFAFVLGLARAVLVADRFVRSGEWSGLSRVGGTAICSPAGRSASSAMAGPGRAWPAGPVRLG